MTNKQKELLCMARYGAVFDIWAPDISSQRLDILLESFESFFFGECKLRLSAFDTVDRTWTVNVWNSEELKGYMMFPYFVGGNIPDMVYNIFCPFYANKKERLLERLLLL